MRNFQEKGEDEKFSFQLVLGSSLPLNNSLMDHSTIFSIQSPSFEDELIVEPCERLSKKGGV